MFLFFIPQSKKVNHAKNFLFKKIYINQYTLFKDPRNSICAPLTFGVLFQKYSDKTNLVFILADMV